MKITHQEAFRLLRASPFIIVGVDYINGLKSTHILASNIVTAYHQDFLEKATKIDIPAYAHEDNDALYMIVYFRYDFDIKNNIDDNNYVVDDWAILDE